MVFFFADSEGSRMAAALEFLRPLGVGVSGTERSLVPRTEETCIVSSGSFDALALRLDRGEVAFLADEAAFSPVTRFL